MDWWEQHLSAIILAQRRTRRQRGNCFANFCIFQNLYTSFPFKISSTTLEKKSFCDSIFFKFIIVEYSLFVTYFFAKAQVISCSFVSGKHTFLSLIMFVYSLCVWRKKQRTVIYLSGLLVSVVIIDIWWLVFNVFSQKESWMYSLLYVLAFYLTTKAITENRHVFCTLETILSQNSSYFAEIKLQTFYLEILSFVKALFPVNWLFHLKTYPNVLFSRFWVLWVYR